MSLALVDASVWIDHLHRHNDGLADALDAGLVVTHPMVIGELALGSIRNRSEFLGLLHQLPSAPNATDAEVLQFVEGRRLYGRGLSLVDAHLLASALIGGDVRLFTRDRRLAEAARSAGVDWR